MGGPFTGNFQNKLVLAVIAVITQNHCPEELEQDLSCTLRPFKMLNWEW
jgi:hypothetical protein